MEPPTVWVVATFTLFCCTSVREFHFKKCLENNCMSHLHIDKRSWSTFWTNQYPCASSLLITWKWRMSCQPADCWWSARCCKPHCRSCTQTRRPSRSSANTIYFAMSQAIIMLLQDIIKFWYFQEHEKLTAHCYGQGQAEQYCTHGVHMASCLFR